MPSYHDQDVFSHQSSVALAISLVFAYVPMAVVAGPAAPGMGADPLPGC